MPDKQVEKNKKALEVKEITSVKSSDDIRRMYSSLDCLDPERAKLSEYRDLDNIKTKLTPVQEKRKKELNQELGMLYGLENGAWLSSLPRTQYFPTVAHMRGMVIKDYHCQTSLELMLADRIVSHYWRAMKNDAVLNRITEEEDGGYSFNQQKINILRELYRGVELSDRQLNIDIILLKELKQPKLNIKVTTENAYIAQNQQVNVDKKNNEAK